MTLGELQGALLDGEAGYAMPKPQKVVQYCKLGFELLVRGGSLRCVNSKWYAGVLFT